MPNFGFWQANFTPLGVPVTVNYLFGFKVNNDGDGRLSFTYTPSNRSNFIKFRVSWNGTERQESWIDGRREWDLIQSHPVDECDMYNRCGAFGKCNEMDLSKCSCMEGFVAKDSACVRRKKLQCEENNSLYVEDRGKKDGFVQIERVKLPDFVDYVGSQDVKECEKMCLDNCSCTAYAFDIGINCMIWNRDLVDVQQFGESGNTLFVRVAHSELAEKNNVKKLVVITTVIIGTFFVCVLIWLIWKCKTNCQAEILNKSETPKVGASGEFPIDFSGTSDLGVEGQQSTGTELAMCIHVGMLCVQDMAAHRPNMANVVLMLESENATLPMPRQPTFTSMRYNLDGDMWNGNQDVVSSNNVTISVILGR
ncbi:hypothetical protein BUALT_Bualt03G0068200 [Buddleja alternifolia]|uniref:non-specific serine/threonine protein kinase n=1 Tax=Buddleja alternifolia TaxID=168488 RepID=A0AAV6XSV9_9LAMI|nr:hypothetical protein BUALT_Bualt03G0068200 [Buddleja alternifolia]